jgi:hypothetical protein
MKSKLMLMAVVVSVLGTHAVASPFLVEGDPKEDHKGGPKPTSAVTIEELRERCSKPGQFNEQHAPKAISVVCSEVSRSWAAGVPGEIPLEGSRTVTVGVVSDKWHVEAVTENVPMKPRLGSCLRFEEIETQVAVEQQLSCDELLGMKGGLAGFCVSALDRDKAGRKGKGGHHGPGHGKPHEGKWVEAVKTGQVIDHCPPGTPDRGKPGHRPGDKPGEGHGPKPTPGQEV